MTRIYCDTCVYVDLFENRQEKFRDLGEFAAQLFRKVKEKKYTLVISDWVLKEFEKVTQRPELMKKLLDEFQKEDVIHVAKDREDEKKARGLSPTNYPDALHVVLAKKGNAVFLVTRDIHYFAEFRDIIEISFPGDL